MINVLFVLILEIITFIKKCVKYHAFSILLTEKNIYLIQVKIWSIATGTTNNTIAVVTKDLECDFKNLLVYTGHGDVMVSGITIDRAHFHGNLKLLNLESYVTNGNGQKQCVFRCEDMCHYVYISVQNVSCESSWKICEVLFN